MFIEKGAIVRAVGVADDCVFDDDRMSLSGAHRLEQAVADGVPIAAPLHRRHRENIGHFRKPLVSPNELGDVIEFRFIDVFAHFEFASCLCRAGDAAFKTLQLRSKIFRVLWLNAVF